MVLQQQEVVWSVVCSRSMVLQQQQQQQRHNNDNNNFIFEAGRKSCFHGRREIGWRRGGRPAPQHCRLVSWEPINDPYSKCRLTTNEQERAC